MLRPMPSASPRPDIDTPRTKERKDVCQRRLAYFESQVQPSPPQQSFSSRNSQGQSAVSRTFSNDLGEPSQVKAGTSQSRNLQQTTTDDVRKSMLRDSRVNAVDHQRPRTSNGRTSARQTSGNHLQDSNLRKSEAGPNLLTSSFKSQVSPPNHPNNTRHQGLSQSCHLDGRLENDLFSKSKSDKSQSIERVKNVEKQSGRQSPRVRSSLGTPRQQTKTSTQFPSLAADQLETDHTTLKHTAHQPDNSLNQSTASDKNISSVKRNDYFDFLDDFSTPLEREAGSRSKQQGKCNNTTVTTFEAHGADTDSDQEIEEPLNEIPLLEKVPSQDSSIDAKSSSCDEAENFKPDNLTSVLGEERYNRLMKNFEESEWISNVDSGREGNVNIFLDDSETEVTSGFGNKPAEEEVELGLQTHRPSATPDIDQTLFHHNKQSHLPETLPAAPTVKDTVKCAFSIDEIYAEANRVSTQGFAFKASESDSDSDDLVSNTFQNHSVKKSHNTATYVFSANDIRASAPHEEPVPNNSFNRNETMDSSLHKSLEGREITLPRHKPFGPVPQLKKQEGEPVHSQDRRAGFNAFGEAAQGQEARKSGDSDKHIEGVRHYVENRNLGTGQAAVLPEDFVGDLPPGTFTNPSLERYFTSIERLSADKSSTLSSDTFEPVPDPEIETTPRESMKVDGQQRPLKGERDRKTENLKQVNQNRNMKVVNLKEGNSKVLQQLQGHDLTDKDDDLFTKVTSIVGEMEPGGLTERLKTLGIEFDFLKKEAQDETEKKHKEEVKDSDEKPKTGTAPAVAKICPDCSKPNKKYVTWCIECGCVLIGVQETLLKGEKQEEPEALKPKQSEEPAFRTSELHSSDAGRHFQNRLEQAWKMENQTSQESSVPNQSSDYVSDNDRLLYNEERNPRESLPNHVRAELSLNLRSSADSSRQSAASAAGPKQAGKPHRTVQASCPDLGDDIEFEYSEEVSRKSLPNALKVELSLDLRSSVNSTPEPPDNDKKVSTNKPKKPQRPRSRQGHRGHGSQMSTVHERQEVAPATAEVAFGGQVVQMEHGRNKDNDIIIDEDDVLIDDDVEDDDDRVDMLDEFVDHLRKDPRFKPNKQGPVRPKSAGVPQPSKSMQPTKSKTRPQSAGKSRVYSSVQSKVRASIEAEPPQRRWEKSSVAWSSYKSSELSKPSSLQIQGQAPRSLRTSQDQGGGDGDVRASRGQPLRPGSAGGRPRSANRGQAGEGDNAGGDGKNGRNRDGSLRNSSGKGLHSKTSAMNTYAKYLSMAKGYTGRLYKTDTPQNPRDKVPDQQFAMSPRIQNGEVSRWLCLPEEILLYIFSFLSHWDLTKVSQVCKNFRRIALDDSLWKYISLKKKSLTDDWLAQIGRHQPASLSLIQCQGKHVTANGLRELFRQCADSLQELDCVGASEGRLTGDNLLLHAASRCRHLRRVDVSWCNVNDNGVTAVAETSDRLEVLCLNGCQAVSDEAIETVVAKHGHSMRELELFGCFNVTARGSTSIATYCKNLTTLNLGQCWKVTDASISYLSSNLKAVEHLDLRGCKQLTDASVTQIVRNCPRLRTLSLANCPNITDVSVGEIATYCPKIRSLDVCSCKKITNSGVKFLATCCHDLEYLDLSSTGIDSKSVSSIASYCNRKLEVVKLNFCKHINLNSLTRLAKNCKKLKKLYIYGLKGIRDINAIRRENHQLWVESSEVNHL